MRQAGRYLPEFKKVRQQFSNFFDLCYNPQAATTVTLQPIERFDLDAAIIFSDILTIPQALGQPIEFVKGVGPVVQPFQLELLKNYQRTTQNLAPVYDAISLTRSKLAASKSLIGFSGGFWTLMYYMLANSKDNLVNLRAIAYQQPSWFIELKEIMIELISEHLMLQIEAGCDVVQIFESWADNCPANLFQSMVIEPTRDIITRIRQRHPEVLVIGFPRGSGNLISNYLATNVDVIGIDWQQDQSWVAANIQPSTMVQGCLDPAVLLTTPEQIITAVAQIGVDFGNFPFIFNLGHGINQFTKVEHVALLVQEVRKLRWQKKSQ